MYSESFPAGRSFIQVLLSCYLSPQVRIVTEEEEVTVRFFYPNFPAVLTTTGMFALVLLLLSM